MKAKNRNFLLGIVGVALSFLIYFVLIPQHDLPELNADDSHDIAKLPKFSEFKDTQKKKEAFFNFLYPIVVEENVFLLNIRQQLIDLQNKTNYSDHELEWLEQLKADYLVEAETVTESITLLLTRVDSIPPSLVLAQAAIESGWGTSRFARKGNNLFGHWCFSKGCGLVPKNRDDDKSHEVAKFSSVNESIRSYLKNLNSFYRYEKFRTLRSQSDIKETGKDVIKLTAGLKAYSELGDVYIKKVQNLIKFNKLEKYDRLFSEHLTKN